LEHPHARGSQMIVELQDPEYGRMLQPGVQARLSLTPGAVRPRPVASPLPLPAGDPWPAPQLALSGNSPALRPTASEGGPLSVLAGVKVLDLCIILAGPTCGRTLAEFGADVIKIDAPDREGGVAFHQDVNRGKRSILLDLKSEAGKAVFWKLVDWADVVVQNYRDGVVQRLGVDYEAVRRRKPEIVYASLNAYGHVGPWAQRPGWEQLAQAATGMQARYGGDGPPVLQPFPVNDYGTGIMGAYAVAAALYHRQRTGEGQHVQTALAYTACTLQSLFLQGYAGKEWNEPRGQQALGWNALQRLYQASDGWLYVGARAEERAGLAAVAGVDSAERLNEAELNAALEAAFVRRPVQEWVERLTAAGIGAQRTATVAELMADPWVMAHGLSLRREHEGLGEITTNGPAPRLSRTPVQPGRPAPPPGSDAASILAEVGLERELEALAGRGVVRLDLAAAR
ncbi:MAG TPA: CoA transferase, partial [Dehalococcoidia bacterium]|nr:CoA transferase [Dehalococcoidia bacterium]